MMGRSHKKQVEYCNAGKMALEAAECLPGRMNRERSQFCDSPRTVVEIPDRGTAGSVPAIGRKLFLSFPSFCRAPSNPLYC
jgi:hypothetical protein